MMDESEENSINSATDMKSSVITIDDNYLNHEEIIEHSKGKVMIKFEQELEQAEVDGSNYKQGYAARKSVAEGMMDIALLTANANQLRFLITYNSNSQTYYISLVLIIISLILQVSVGIGLIFRRRMRNRKRNNKISRTNDFLVGGIFMITVVNVFIASFTITDA